MNIYICSVIYVIICAKKIYFGDTTFPQRKYLFELVKESGNIAKACRIAKVSRGTYYNWKERYEKDGIEGLREPKSCAPHNPHKVNPEIEKRIVELKREHSNWGKKTIAQVIWKEHNWEKVVAIETVKNILERHGLWNPEKKKKRIKNKGTTSDQPNKTINIDLCFIPAESIHEHDFSAFFQFMDEFSKTDCEIIGRSVAKTTSCGVDIFSQEDKKYDEKMEEYLLMRKNKKDTKEEKKKNEDIMAMEEKAHQKQKAEELRAQRRKIRIGRKKEDINWKRFREGRKKLTDKEKKLSKDEKKKINAEWKEKSAERRVLKMNRKTEDEEWRRKQKENKEQAMITISSLVAILVIIDNCTRKCFGLPLFMQGKRVNADDIIKALEKQLPPDLKYLISDNGKQFIAEAFQKLCMKHNILHLRITPHRPATNGIAERFVERLKDMLAEREWRNEKELLKILEEVMNEYNDFPHQGLDGLSPNEFERKILCATST